MARSIWPAVAAYVALVAVTLLTIVYTNQELHWSGLPEAYMNPKSPVVHYEWTVDETVLAPDGVQRPFKVVNGQLPGPELRATRGQSVAIKVNNRLNESVTIHWHGLSQRGTNLMDGAAGVTQCGIPPGQSFTYRFKLNESGTYWWHGHSGVQRLDGLYGALIVTDPEEDQYSLAQGSYDDEIVVLLQDHYHKDEAMEVYDAYSHKKTMSMEPVPDSGLINGLNTIDCDRIANKNHRLKCVGPGSLAKFTFEKGLRYRIRIINAAALAAFDFSIDEHDLTIIEADSTEIEPVQSHYVTLTTGQRYSVIVEANSDRDAVFMRAHMNTECFNYVNRVLTPELQAVIEYKSNEIDHELRARSMPETEAWPDRPDQTPCLDHDQTLFRPLNGGRVPEPDMRLYVYPRVMKLMQADLRPYSFFNRTSWRSSPGAPNTHVALGHVQEQDMVTIKVPELRENANTPKWGGNQLIQELPYGAVVELVINNADEDSHPFHLHGHDFWVLRQYGGEPSMGLGKWFPEYEDKYLVENPIKRDTFTVPRFGHAVIRFRADNVGIWAFHCHIEWHMMAGMLMQFATGLDQFDEHVSQTMLDHCQYERDNFVDEFEL